MAVLLLIQFEGLFQIWAARSEDAVSVNPSTGKAGARAAVPEQPREKTASERNMLKSRKIYKYI